MPKLLSSDSLTVDLMKQANMDQYLDFQPIDKLLYFDGEKFLPTPTSKQDIFSTSVLSIMQKKKMLALLKALVKLKRRISNTTPDVNSLNEFK